MATVPVVPDFVAGEKVTSAKMRQVRDVLNWTMTSSPLFDAVQTAAQSLADGTWVPVTFSGETIDRDSGHSTAANTSRYTAQTPGWYRVIGTGAVNIGTGRMHVAIAKNGTKVPSGSGALGNALGVAASPTEAVVYLNGTTDYVELMVAQVTGATANTAVLNDFACHLSVQWLSN